MIKQILVCMFLVYGILIFCSQAFAIDLSKADIDHIDSRRQSCQGIFYVSNSGLYCFKNKSDYLKHLEWVNRIDDAFERLDGKELDKELEIIREEREEL